MAADVNTRRDWRVKSGNFNQVNVAVGAKSSGIFARQRHQPHQPTHGAFVNRQQLQQVTGLGAKTFEQCAGFLRIRGGDNVLDMTAVHPESYATVERMTTLRRENAVEHPSVAGVPRGREFLLLTSKLGNIGPGSPIAAAGFTSS